MLRFYSFPVPRATAGSTMILGLVLSAALPVGRASAQATPEVTVISASGTSTSQTYAWLQQTYGVETTMPATLTLNDKGQLTSLVGTSFNIAGHLIESQMGPNFAIQANGSLLFQTGNTIGPLGAVVTIGSSVIAGTLLTTGSLGTAGSLVLASTGTTISGITTGASTITVPTATSGTLQVGQNLTLGLLVSLNAFNWDSPDPIIVNDSSAWNIPVTAPLVIVSAAGELRGTGVIHAPTTVFGTLAPGNSPGTLTFTAPLVLAPGSVTQLDIDGTGTGAGAGNYSRIIVNGADATLGGTLSPRLRGITGSASNSYTPPLGQEFQVIRADGGLSGSFTGLAQPAGLPLGTRFDAIYGPTTLTLVVTPASYANLPLAGLPETGNQAALGAVLDAVRPAAGVRPGTTAAAVFTPLYTLSGSALPAALDQLSPGIYGDAVMAARATWYEVADAIGARLAARRGAAPADTGSSPHDFTAWANGLGAFSHVGGSDAPGFHTSFGGAAAGADLPVTPGALAGFAVAGGSLHSTASSGARAGGTAVQFLAYGGWQSGPLFLDAQGGYLHADQDVRRDLSPWGISARGNTAVQGGGVQVSGGVHLEFGRWQLEPLAALSVLSLGMPDVWETAANGLAAHVAGQSLTSVQSLAAVRVATRVALTPTLPLRVHALLGWSHEFADTRTGSSATLAFAGPAAFAVQSAAISRDAARIDAGFELPVSATTAAYAEYAATVGSQLVAHNLTGGIRIRW